VAGGAVDRREISAVLAGLALGVAVTLRATELAVARAAVLVAVDAGGRELAPSTTAP